MRDFHQNCNVTTCPHPCQQVSKLDKKHGAECKAHGAFCICAWCMVQSAYIYDELRWQKLAEISLQIQFPI